MSVFRMVGLTSTGSAEKPISVVLKEEKGRKLETAQVEEGYCKITFSEDKYVLPKRKKTIVKEFSKKKYINVERALIVFNNRPENQYYFFGCTYPIWKCIQVIELPNSWIVFFER